MNTTEITANVQPTMSSREIADTCNARHNDVIATIERLFERGLLRESRKTLRTLKTKGRPIRVYDLTKRDCLLVVSGYRDDIRAKLIDRWMDLEAKQAEQVEGRAARAAARLEAPFMTDAVKHDRASQGKGVSHYHFSNEFDLINRIALGKSAKQYRADHGIPANESIRDHLTPCEIKCIEHLQRVNASMIDIGMKYSDRKARLNQIYIQRHAARLFAEVHQLEA